jgi:hypothetical protein
MHWYSLLKYKHIIKLAVATDKPWEGLQSRRGQIVTVDNLMGTVYDLLKETDSLPKSTDKFSYYNQLLDASKGLLTVEEHFLCRQFLAEFELA